MGTGKVVMFHSSLPGACYAFSVKIFPFFSRSDIVSRKLMTILAMRLFFLPSTRTPSTLFKRVSHVRRVITKKKMFRINTPRIVARVANQFFSFQLYFIQLLENPTMSNARLSKILKSSITAHIKCCLPLDTIVNLFGLRPKSFDRSHLCQK